MENKNTIPKLSVIIPIYNSEQYIEECVNTISGIRMDELEIILVNDGSTDNSYDRCAKLMQQDYRIKLYDKENGGSASARNYGIEKALGEYITFIDSDDYIDSDAYFVAFQKTYENQADIGCFGMVSDENGAIRVPEEYAGSIWELFIRKQIYMHSVCNKFFKRSVINAIRFDEDLVVCEDMLFCCRAFQAAKSVLFFDSCIYKYRKKADSVTHATISEKKSRDDVEAADRLLKYCDGKDQKDVERLAAFRHQIAALRFLTEPDVFSIKKYRMYVMDKRAYKELEDRKHRILCWCANHSIDIIPLIFITLKKIKQRGYN